MHVLHETALKCLFFTGITLNNVESGVTVDGVAQWLESRLTGEVSLACVMACS